jgi:hypothetical protein
MPAGSRTWARLAPHRGSETDGRQVAGERTAGEELLGLASNTLAAPVTPVRRIVYRNPRLARGGAMPRRSISEAKRSGTNRRGAASAIAWPSSTGKSATSSASTPAWLSARVAALHVRRKSGLA